MSFRHDIKNLNFFIAGAAKSGISAAKLLKKHGVNVFITDDNPLLNEIQNELIELNIPFEQNGHSFEKIKNECDIMVLSPGIMQSKPISLLCKKNNIPVVSEIEVASWFMSTDDICLAVTGTNGKSTTVHYLAQLVAQSQYNTKACGNIGTSLSQTLLEFPNTNLFAMELSSYQLETTYSIRPLCTALLNLQNDHLSRYENLEEYLKAKWRLILLTHDSGIAIIDKKIMKLVLKLGLSLPRARVILLEESVQDENNFTKSKLNNLIDKFEFSKTLPCPTYQELNNLEFENLVFLNNFEFVYAKYNFENGHINISINLKNLQKKWTIENSCLPGQHNMTNILCASLMALHIGISENIILNQWSATSSKYEHLPHRLEKISNGITIYKDNNRKEKKLLIINDSKATNVESTLVALNSFQSPIRLLLGGEPKGDSYLPITPYFTKNLVKVYPFGKAKNLISNELLKSKNYIAKSSDNLISAANLALDEAKENEIILLSPGCSSFDEFQNFEHRGHVFRKWALSHLKENHRELN
ncbi:UDP-N-acetylmuramoyl-L-alanine--D-glutamate ligase [Silvanigrella aquatica]|uniref:UDP-N-acetylmuramoylalanine--D-glutamate ligase n=1 Tax=Silvanigrella aquatica TaxID=1915309 RepID=A0A1L4CWY3_9BACT|nr:UDP-N-acetylmuramoyl-L-alanine--D-glutamate ligase [Silvanigrella aquatica]APJ02460.1 UDP-N-acetylmuramoylalanine--D-glutamate ligase [Silvanigrella aquatica]